jgi:hypothetical protein
MDPRQGLDTTTTRNGLIKLGALMSSTGKSEKMASIFVIASNDFMTEHHDGHAHLEVPANQPAMTEDEPKQLKRRQEDEVAGPGKRGKEEEQSVSSDCNKTGCASLQRTHQSNW